MYNLIMKVLNNQPSFETDIKPLFRDLDQHSMHWKFDLWSYDDVKRHAEVILQRLTAGRMPCDGAWPPEKLAVLRQWIEGGMLK